jgi:hypothetical protein
VAAQARQNWSRFAAMVFLAAAHFPCNKPQDAPPELKRRMTSPRTQSARWDCRAYDLAAYSFSIKIHRGEAAHQSTQLIQDCMDALLN